MYFWNIEKLKKSIKNSDLSEKDKFLYALFFLIPMYIFYEIDKWFPATKSPNFLDGVVSSSYIFICLLGSLYAFKSNGGNKGTDFLGKYFSVSFVLSIRFLVFMVLLLLVFEIGSNIITGGHLEKNELYEAILLIFVEILFYWRLATHINDTITDKLIETTSNVELYELTNPLGKYTIGGLLSSVIMNCFLALIFAAIILFVPIKAGFSILIYFGKLDFAELLNNNIKNIFTICAIVFWYLFTLEDFRSSKGIKYLFKSMILKVIPKYKS